MFVSKEVKRFGWSGVNISTASLPALTAVFGRQTPAKPENTLQLWRTLNTQRRGGGKNFGLCPPFPYPPQNGQNKKATGKEKKMVEIVGMCGAGQGQKSTGRGGAGAGVKIQSILWENKHPQCGFHIHIFTILHIFTWQWVSEGNIYQNLVFFLVITVLNFNGLSTFTVGQGKICGVGRASLRECVREQIHVVICLFQ